jgi:pilus assembly protein FimV
VLLLLPASAAFAVGLGGLSVQSALNEPLKATVPVYGVTDEERRSLRVILAPREAFRAAGLERADLLSGLKFSLDQVNGEDLIRITSEQPIAEPYLHFLVELNWAGGRLLREYTALLDPPLYAEQQARPVTAPVTAPPPPAPVAMPEPAPQPKAPKAKAEAAAPPPPPAAPSKAQAEPSAPPKKGLLGPPKVSQGRSEVFDTGPVAAEATAPAAAVDEIGPTRSGDTLWKIAQDLKPRLGVDEYQIMAALVRENPEAFIDGNMNLLKRGQILSVPDAEDVRAISRDSAVADYSTQLDAWEQYRQRLAASAPVVAEAGGAKPAAPAMEKKPAAAKKAGAEPTTAAGAEKEGSDLLRIVQASADADTQGSQAEAGGTSEKAGNGAKGPGEAELSTMRAKLATLEEDVVTKESENSELRERVKMLEEQVANAQRLISIQEENLALAQRQAEQAAEARRAAPAEESAKAAQPPAPAQTAAAEPAAAAATAPPPAAVEPVKPAPVKPAAKPAPKPAAPPAPSKARVVQAPPEKSLMDTVMDFLSGWVSTVGVGIAVVLLGVVGLWFYRRRRSIAEFEESILSGSALDSRPNTGDSSDEAPGTDTSFLSDFGVPGMGSMHADEVDPLAEAEVYLAYGRSEQAEEVLKEAITRLPDRAELKLKLLEIYQQRGDVKGFETFAEEMYPAMGEDQDDLWPKIAAMGRKLNPGNPLFRIENVAGAESGGASASDDEIAVPTPGDTLEPFPEPEPDDGLELDLDEFMEAEDEGEASGTDLAAAAATGEEGIEFSLEDEAAAGEELDLDATLNVESPLGGDQEGFEFKEPGGTASLLEEDTAELDAPAPTDAESTDTLDLEAPVGDEEELTLDFGDEELTPADVEDTDRLAKVHEGVAGTEDVARTQKLPTLDDADFNLSAELDAGELEWETDEAEIGSGLEFDSPDMQTAEPEFAPAEEAEVGAEAAMQAGAEEAGQVDWDETATKLDLAKAYIDMGDEAGARSILDEVLEEGDDAQRRQAQELASQLTASA